MTYRWEDCEPAFIAQRYDRIAGLIDLVDWILFTPTELRRCAPEHLGLNPGDRVLEVGCGTGRNFPYLREAVGPGGRIYGVDLSSGMLRKAQALCDHRQWTNVKLTKCDAADYVAPEPLDGVLFGLCYNTMPHHLAVLQHCWEQLRPGGRLVIIDGKVPPGLGGRLIRPFSIWLMKHTMLGNPQIEPWKHLAALTQDFEMREMLFRSWYVCRGTKPARSDVARPHLLQMMAAE